jgi:carbon-monoxide dehydrogenase medium subunit
LLVDLGRSPGLDAISIDDDGVRLGAMVRWCDILEHPRLRTAHPLLVEAVGHVAHWPIRNRGTVGGSLAHADPAAELPGIVFACDATLVLASLAGARTVAARDFFTGPLSTVLGAAELIVEVCLPRWPAQRRWGFVEFARQRGAFALAAIAAFYDEHDGIACDTRIGVIGATGVVQRLPAAEAALDGGPVDSDRIAGVAAAAREEVEPTDDIDASAAYRRALVGTLVERALAAAVARAAPRPAP